MTLEHGRLTRWCKWRACDVGKAKGWRMSCDIGETTEKLENELWHRWSERRVGEWAVMQVKQWKGWRMSCDIGKATEGSENELWRRWSDSSFSNPSFTSPTSQALHLHHLASCPWPPRWPNLSINKPVSWVRNREKYMGRPRNTHTKT